MAIANELKSALAQDADDQEVKDLQKELLRAQVKRERDRDAEDQEEKELKRQLLRAQIEMVNAQRRALGTGSPSNADTGRRQSILGSGFQVPFFGSSST